MKCSNFLAISRAMLLLLGITLSGCIGQDDVEAREPYAKVTWEDTTAQSVAHCSKLTFESRDKVRKFNRPDDIDIFVRGADPIVHDYRLKPHFVPPAARLTGSTLAGPQLMMFFYSNRAEIMAGGYNMAGNKNRGMADIVFNCVTQTGGKIVSRYWYADGSESR